ncbi:Hsp70 family protein, partial [Rhodococcus tukisamuensis]
MTAGLGLRVGDTTATAILQRGGDLLDEPPAVVRAATLLLGEDAAVLGAPADREGVLSRFTSRVGDPAGLSAPDGTSYLAEDLVATAVSGLLLAATAEFPDDFPNNAALPVVATYPSHWDAATVAALREALDHVGQASVTLMPDAVAAVAWLEAAHGPLGDAVVAVYHLGSAGLDVSLVRTGEDAGLLRPSTYTTLFGGDSLDRTVVEHVLSVVAADLGPVDTADPATRAQLTTLRERCREAREQLSTQDTAAVPVEVGGAHTSVTLTRTELDEMLRGQVAGSLTMVEESIRAHELEPAGVRTVLLTGGGSAMPLVAELAAQTLDLPTVSAPEPGRAVAHGAAILAGGAGPALLASGGIALAVGGVALAADAAALDGDAAPASPLDGDADTDSIPVVTPDAGLST